MSGLSERLADWEPLAGAEGVPGAAAPRPYVLLDVFTSTPLAGNALAVVTDARGLADREMQALARELNLSETVFLLDAEHGGDARARIFTPAAELPFAGHPLIGAAVVLAGALEIAAITIETAAGAVPLEVSDGRGGAPSATMIQPLPSRHEFEGETELLAALGVERSELPVQEYRNGPRHVFVALAGEGAVARLDPDLGALRAAAGNLCVSCFAGEGTRFKTRMFAPGLGVPEDPATGSAAGPLAVHLLRHGRIELGREIEIAQGAEIGRPSLLLARVDGTAGRLEQVRVRGSAVVVGRGALRPR